VAAVPVIIGYPLAKRFFPIPQLVLSIAWGFAVLISWTAVTAHLELATGLLWGATVFWTLGFDTVYAMSDREDDQKIGINSSAIFFGNYAPEAVGVCFAITSGLLAYMSLEIGLGWMFWPTWILATVAWGVQYFYLRQADIPRPTYGQVFSQNVAIGFVLLVGMILGTY
jgi:4-hydroxybenzoate polyprenyltransferase